MKFVALLLFASVLVAQDASTVLEPRSEVAFPTSLPVPGSEDVQVLTGMGLRTKTIFSVKVYAFGLYVDADGARERLARWKGKDAETLMDDERFYAALLEREFAMTLRLVMCRGVGGEDMRDAFENALRPRVKAAKEREMFGGNKALNEFRTFFSEDKLEKGVELIFRATPEGRLATFIDGEAQPVIENKALCWALFDVYLGRSPVEKQGKRRLVARFPALLVGGGESDR